MDQSRLLTVIRLPLISPQQIASCLRIHRLRSEQETHGGPLLFFCDLPDADAQTLPADADLIRCVQSGVMSMNARRPGKYFFLVRKRAYSAALCMWLGENQATPVREAIHPLLHGISAEPPEAANLGRDSLKDACDAALIVDASLSMLPGTPEKMCNALYAGGASSLRGKIILPKRREEVLFVRLLREGFTPLSPYTSARMTPEEPLAAIYTTDALNSPAPEKTAKTCLFLLEHPPTLSDCFRRVSLRFAHGKSFPDPTPIAELAALLLAAFLGWQWLALAALLIAEWPSTLHVRQLPCALIRLVFLPRRALIGLNALLDRRCFRSPYRLRLSCGSGVCPVFAAALLFLSLRSTGAVVISLSISLLWLMAPTVERALSLPVRERIPLDEREQRQLNHLTQDAFFRLSAGTSSPAHLLAVCAGCMLGLLEPDEAARRAEGMIPRLKTGSAFDAACILAAAQFFTERMADCDAALRALPAQLEQLVTLPNGENGGILMTLLDAAYKKRSSSSALDALSQSPPDTGMAALFLPRSQISGSDLFLPVTHPHTYLKRIRLLAAPDSETKKSDPFFPEEEANRFLILACAALDAPFHALLMRSARIAPYAPLLAAY